MEKVSFKQMKDGTKEDYELLGRYEERFVKDLPDRLLEMLKGLDSSLDGYQISRLEHSLQSATRAEKDGADEEKQKDKFMNTQAVLKYQKISLQYLLSSV